MTMFLVPPALTPCSAGTFLELEAKLQTFDDKDFHQAHELVIRKTSAAANVGAAGIAAAISGVGGIKVGVKFLVGETGQLRKEHSLLFKNVSEVRKLGFPNVIMPGDVRFGRIFQRHLSD